jgi:hypothetical protein
MEREFEFNVCFGFLLKFAGGISFILVDYSFLGVTLIELV